MIIKYFDHQAARFLDHGWEEAEAVSMLAAYDSVIPQELKVRVARLELFDEIEEWSLLMSHYCLTTAVKGSAFQGLRLAQRTGSDVVLPFCERTPMGGTVTFGNDRKVCITPP